MDDNPYLDEFKREVKGSNYSNHQWLGERKRLVEKYSWAIPNRRSLRYLDMFDGVVEIGAGSGYWAWCVRARNNTPIHAIDIDPPEGTWTHVVEGDIETAEEYLDKYDNPAILLCWPPCSNEMASRVLQTYNDDIIYVGDTTCTGNEEFHQMLSENYAKCDIIDIPSYEGINDKMYHYIQKS